MSSDIHASVHDQLRRSRQRYTMGRQQLVDLLVDADRPLTIPELMDSGARQSQSSLYRNLAVLEQCGVVRRIASIDDVARYELTEELTEHHHHLVCSDCGRVDDVVLPRALERSLTKASQQAAEQQGYEIDTHRLEFVGNCSDCH